MSSLSPHAERLFRLGRALLRLGRPLVPAWRRDEWLREWESELWHRLDPASLDATKAVTQRYLFPWLWDPIAIWILLQPAAAVLGVLGLLIAWLARR